MGVGSGGQRDGADIVDKGLIVLFFGLFCYFLVIFSVPPYTLEEA